MLDTLEHHRHLLHIARAAESVLAANPELPDVRVLNRLHAEGIVCTDSDLLAARALANETKPAQQGISTKAFADLLGIAREELGALLENAGTPPVRSVSDGRGTYYDFIDCDRLKAWWERSQAERAALAALPPLEIGQELRLTESIYRELLEANWNRKTLSTLARYPLVIDDDNDEETIVVVQGQTVRFPLELARRMRIAWLGAHP